MIRSALVGVVLSCLFAIQVLALSRTAASWRELPKGEGAVAAIPASILKITSLDYDGVASDYLFLEALVFMGSTFERKERPRVKDWEWKWLYNVLDASAVLDPYFRDPYYFANANLAWEGGLINETNALLERGTRFRSWDHLLPFFMGFNYFYFLQDYEKASDALMTASERPDASPLYASLAAKLAYKTKRTETAISFLELMVKKTNDELMRAEYQNRLQVLQGVVSLEQGVQEYRARYGRTPRTVQALLQKGIIRELPPDPFGGKYYLDERGEVRTTSEYVIMPHLRKK